MEEEEARIPRYPRMLKRRGSSDCCDTMDECKAHDQATIPRDGGDKMIKRGIVVKGLPLLCALLIIGPAATVPADESPITLLDEARAQINGLQFKEAMSTLQALMLKVWSASPMFVAKAVLVEKKASGFGMYQPRVNNVFKKKEPILIYVEPVGYTINRKGDIFSFGLETDFSLLDMNGKVLGGQRNFGKWAWNSHSPNMEIFMNLDFTLTGLSPGKYAIECVVRDKNSDKRAAVRKIIEIR
jgi:hypothetical protein